MKEEHDINAKFSLLWTILTMGILFGYAIVSSCSKSEEMCEQQIESISDFLSRTTSLGTCYIYRINGIDSECFTRDYAERQRANHNIGDCIDEGTRFWKLNAIHKEETEKS